MLISFVKTNFFKLSRPFSKLAKLTADLSTRRIKAKPDEVDKDPDKEKLVLALNRREKEVAELDNEYKCVTLEERLAQYKVEKDGTVVAAFLAEDGKKRTFKNLETYKNFCQNKISRHLNRLKHRLTPMQLYVTQDCGSEKPFTGAHWYKHCRGTYCCIVCTQRIFT